MFVLGLYDVKRIRMSLDSSVHFLQPNAVEPWRVVTNFSKLDDDVVAEAQAEMDRKFANYEVTDHGDMLHSSLCAC